MKDDPIAKSLKERMDAGGITQVIQKKGDKQSGKIGKVELPKGVGKVNKKGNEEEKNGDLVNAPDKKRPQTSAGLSTPSNKGNKKAVFPSKDDDKDDPIAQHLKAREKAGGITTILSAADAKKAGLKVGGAESKESKINKIGSSNKNLKEEKKGKEGTFHGRGF